MRLAPKFQGRCWRSGATGGWNVPVQCSCVVVEPMLSGLWSKFARLAAPSQPPGSYRVFTTRFDLEVPCEGLSEVIGRRESPAFGDYVAHFEQAIAQWRAVAESVVTEFVDRVKAVSGRRENTIACLLIDHSGSMRNQPSIIAATLATIVAECWSRLGIRY